MKKILFLIHDLGQGGAEKVLVNLVNNMDRSKFDISVTVLFGGGVNEQFLKPDIHFHAVFPKEVPGNSKLMKLLTPKQLHKLCVRGQYDIEVCYLEGPSARVISGCTARDTKLVAWIHSTIKDSLDLASSFRSIAEARKCYSRFNKIIAVSQGIRDAFCGAIKIETECIVLYNTVESAKILEKSLENVPELSDEDDKTVSIISVGSLKQVKGFDRLFQIVKRLVDNQYSIHLYILGIGPQQKELDRYITRHSLNDNITLLGYHINPYKFVAGCDLFVCSSYSEGFSTAVTEALIVGTPVCTVDVSGMREMLGDSRYGLITENSEEALYQGIKSLLDDPDLLEHYRRQAVVRGKDFSTENTVKAVENMLMDVIGSNDNTR